MESHYNQDQNLVMGFLRDIRHQIPPNTSLLCEKYDKYRDPAYIPLIVIHYTCFYYYRRIAFFLLSSGSSEAQNPKYNQFKIIGVPNLYEQQNELKYENTQYVLKLHGWNKNLNPLTAKLNQAGPKSKKGKGKGKKGKKGKGKLGADMSPKNLGLPGATRSAPSSPKHDRGKKGGSLMPSKKRGMLIKGNNHFSTKSQGFLGGELNLGALFDEDDDGGGGKKKKKKGKKASNGKKPNHMRRAKSVSVLPQVTGSVMSKINNNVDFDKYSFGKGCISMLEIPKWGWLKKKKIESGGGKRYGHYHILFRCGGIKAEFDDHTDEIDMILFNTANCNYNGLNNDRDVILDAYYQKLPKFRNTMESPFMIFDKRKSSLYAFGGYNDGKALQTIHECNMNVKNVSGLKWKKNRNKQQMLKGRYKTNVCYIGNNKYIIMGGTNQKSKPMKSCEIYDNYDKCEEEYCLSIADLNFKRSKLSSCFVPQTNKVIAGGGLIYGKGSTQIEIYDIQKNKWKLNKAEFNFEHKYPLLWMDFYNPNIVMVAGDWIGFGGRKDSLGYMEWLDLREKQKKWNMFSDDTLTDMFKIQGVRANLWESRTLTLL